MALRLYWTRKKGAPDTGQVVVAPPPGPGPGPGPSDGNALITDAGLALITDDGQEIVVV